MGGELSWWTRQTHPTPSSCGPGALKKSKGFKWPFDNGRRFLWKNLPPRFMEVFHHISMIFSFGVYLQYIDVPSFGENVFCDFNDFKSRIPGSCTWHPMALRCCQCRAPTPGALTPAMVEVCQPTPTMDFWTVASGLFLNEALCCLGKASVWQYFWFFLAVHRKVIQVEVSKSSVSTRHGNFWDSHVFVGYFVDTLGPHASLKRTKSWMWCTSIPWDLVRLFSSRAIRAGSRCRGPLISIP